MTKAKRLLCVDDEPQNLELLKAILEPRGYEIVTAANGMDALARIADSRVNLVLLDVMMSPINGFDVCAKIREHERFRTIPVVLITALSSKNDRIKGIESGADDFITKPFDREEVLARVRMLLKMRELDEELQSSYNRMAAVTDIGYDIMKEFDPGLFQIERWLDRIVRSALRGQDTDPEYPEAVIIGIKRNDGMWDWSLRTRQGDTIETLPVRMDPSLSRECGEGRSFAIAQGAGEDNRFPHIARSLEPYGIILENAVIHASDRLCAVMCNYRKEINRYDTVSLHYLVTQCHFMREISAQTHETASAFAYTVGALARAAEANDEDTGNHIVRVGEYAAALGRSLGLTDRACEELRIQAQLHDVGKVHIPPEILKKPGKLAPDEFDLIKTHTTLGAHIIGGHARLAPGASLALTHHEKWDGSGYPGGLKGPEIPVTGRILSIADQYDALRAKRVYKPAFDHETAVRIIIDGDGRTVPSHFDPDVLNAFKTSIGLFEEIYGRLVD